MTATERQRQVLIVEDEETNLILLSAIMKKTGFQVLEARDARQTLDIVKDTIPDIILMDIILPGGMNGIELCRELKKNEQITNIPIIFLTARDHEADIVQGFEAGGHDYLTKPFFLAELVARVKTHVRLYDALLEIERLRQLAFDTNPMTRLPGNSVINEVLQKAIDTKADMTAIYCDLDNFKAFNDRYGFLRGDEVIQFTAATLIRIIEEHCGDQAFLGHIGGDDFFMLLPNNQRDQIIEDLLTCFSKHIVSFYDTDDSINGYIEIYDRQRRQRRFSIISLSLSGVDLNQHIFSHAVEIAARCAEVKQKAKQISGNSFVLDRRENTG